MNRGILVICSLALLFSSCSRNTLITDRKSNKFNLVEPEFEYLNTKSKIKYKDGDHNVSTTASIRIKKDSVIWMSITPIFGIEAARAMITQDSMVFLNRLQKEYVVYDFKNLSEKYNFDINYELIQSMILGEMPIQANGQDEIISNKDYFIVKQQNGSYSIDNYISKRLMQVEKVQMSQKPTKNSLTLQYDDFKSMKKAFHLPFSGDISLNYEENDQVKNTAITIKHGKAEISDVSLSFPFSIPARYARK